MATNGLYARGLFSGSDMGTEGLYVRGLFGSGSGVDDASPNPTEPGDVTGGGWRGPFAFLFALLLGRLLGG